METPVKQILEKFLPRRLSQAVEGLDVKYNKETIYRNLSEIGAGGMGTVYAAEQVKLKRQVALKVLKGSYSRDDNFTRRFRQEAELAASLNHRNIVTIYDSGRSDDGRLYIAMEYLRGQKLSDFIKPNIKLDIDRVIWIGLQILGGLQAAHASEVIHRDIKPDNVMLIGMNGTEEIKILDFGVARPQESSVTLTQTGSLVGTPAYMAPEQLDNGKVTKQSDLYAVGIVLYELLSGTRLFRGATYTAIIKSRYTNPLEPISKLRQDVPICVERIIMQALQEDPARRQKTAGEMAQQFRDAAQELHVVDVASGIGRPSIGLGAMSNRERASEPELRLVKDPASGLLDLSRTPPQDAESSARTELFEEEPRTSAPPARGYFQRNSRYLLLIAGLALASVIGGILYQTTRPPELLSLVLHPSPQKTTFEPNETTTLNVKGEFSDGTSKVNIPGTKWQSNNSSVIEVIDGKLEAKKEGVAEVTATNGSRSTPPLRLVVKAPLPPPVQPPAVPELKALILIAPRREIKVNERFRLDLKGRYSDSKELGVESAQWKSSNPLVVDVDPKGGAIARGAGTAVITANYKGAEARVTLVVKTAPPPKNGPNEEQPSPKEQPVPPPLPKPDLARANALYLEGRYKESLAEIDKVLAMIPNSIEAQNLRRRVFNACKKDGDCS